MRVTLRDEGDMSLSTMPTGVRSGSPLCMRLRKNAVVSSGTSTMAMTYMRRAVSCAAPSLMESVNADIPGVLFCVDYGHART